MNILQISANDNRIGGASGVALKIKEGLEKKGFTTSLFCGIKTSKEKNIFEIPKRKIDRLKSIIFANDMSFFKTDFILETNEFKEADIIHCHNLHGWYFNLKTLEKMSSQKPIIWTFHDMWPITSHCAHSFDGVIKNDFYECPNLNIYPSLLWHNEKKLTNIKRKIYNNSSFDIVTPSLWLKEKIKGTILDNKETHLIYNGIDINTYTPKNKKESRVRLGLPLNKKIILFISNSGIKTSFKGGEFFLKMSQKFINDESVIFICLGGNENKKEKNINYFRKTANEKTLSCFFSASDILLYPSLADNFPLVILEAMSCGLPIVSFNTGGIKEAVLNKLNGYIAKYGDFEDLFNGVKHILKLNKNDIKEISINSRERVIKNYNYDKMVSEYIKLYEYIIQK